MFVVVLLFAGVMAMGALACALAFPRPETDGLPRVAKPREPVPRQVLTLEIGPGDWQLFLPPSSFSRVRV